MDDACTLQGASPAVGVQCLRNSSISGTAQHRNRSLSLVTKAVSRCRMPPVGLLPGSTLLSSRRIPWVQQSDAVSGEFLLSLNRGDVSGDEDVDDSPGRARWFEQFLLCGRRSGSRVDSSDDEDEENYARDQPRSSVSSGHRFSEVVCSESEIDSDSQVRVSARNSFEVVDVLGAFVGAMTPWSSRRGQSISTGTEPEDSSISPVNARRAHSDSNASNVSKGCTVAKRLMDQISIDTREVASELMEQVSQDTRVVASAASDLMGQATAASDAIRRRATEEVLRLTAEHSKHRDDTFWMEPSSRANYVVLHTAASTDAGQPGLHAGSVAKLAKKASRDALKASRKGLRISRKASSKLWKEAPDRHEVGRMSRKLWEERPDLAKVSSKLWQDSSKLWNDAPGLATIFAAGSQRKSHSDGDIGRADGMIDLRVDETSLAEVGSAGNACVDSLQCHMLFASPLWWEKDLVVVLPIELPLESIVDVIDSLGLCFYSTSPRVVSKVRADGQIGKFNATCRRLEDMVRPGDRFASLTVAGVGTSAGSIVNALKDILLRSSAHLSPRRDVRMELVFVGSRSLAPIRINQEIAALQRSGCDVVTRAATVQNFRNLVSRDGCRIMLISLHSAVIDEPMLFLEDKTGKAHLFRSSDLQDLLRRGQEKQGIHLVFLNTCHSLSMGVHFVAAGVRHVLCVRDDDEVRDESCRVFAEEFFTALRAGRSVRQAFECGCARLSCSNEEHLRNDSSKFVLLPAGGSHDEVYFSGEAARSKSPIFPLDGGSWGAVLPRIEDFVGREFDIHNILRTLTYHRFLVLTGCSGIGKSALMSEVGRFLLLRGEPFEEVRWIDSIDEHLSKSCHSGLLDLCERLTLAPERRVLLLVDDPEALTGVLFPRLLRFEFVYTVVALSQAVDGLEICSRLNDTAQAAGVKPVQLSLGPLDLLAQARLFLSRASRPIYTSDLKGGPCNYELISQQLSPAELIAVAQSPRLRALEGNPRHIIMAAQALECSDPADSESAASSIPGTPRGLRRVRLVRPDGKYRDEWIRGDEQMHEISKEHTPKSMKGIADVFVMGCRAHPSTRLEEFPDSEEGRIVLELRTPVENDW